MLELFYLRKDSNSYWISIKSLKKNTDIFDNALKKIPLDTLCAKSFEITFFNKSSEVLNAGAYLTVCSTVKVTADSRFSNKNTQIL